jgi:hypothetical protein
MSVAALGPHLYPAMLFKQTNDLSHFHRHDRAIVWHGN